MDDLDGPGRIDTGRSRLRALWTVWSVEVRVLSGALGKPRFCGAFFLPEWTLTEAFRNSDCAQIAHTWWWWRRRRWLPEQSPGGGGGGGSSEPPPAVHGSWFSLESTLTTNEVDRVAPR